MGFELRGPSARIAYREDDVSVAKVRQRCLDPRWAIAGSAPGDLVGYPLPVVGFSTVAFTPTPRGQSTARLLDKLEILVGGPERAGDLEMAGCVCERMPHYSLGTKILRGPPMLITLPLVILAVLAAVLAWHRHTRRDWLLALSLFAYSPAIVAYGAISKQNLETGPGLTFWNEDALPIALAALLVHSAAAIWFSKSRLLVAAMAPLAIWLTLMAAIVTEMSVNGVWF